MKLAAFVDDRVANLKQTVGNLSESHLMMMASLVIADELDEALIQMEEMETGGAAASGATPTTKPSDHEGTATGPDPLEERAANALEACASRLESIATRLEGA